MDEPADHPDRVANYRCKDCGKLWWKAVAFNRRWRCPACGGYCERITPDRGIPIEPKELT